MATNETELIFKTDSVLNATLLILNMVAEGQNNHTINFVEITDELPEVEGTVVFGLPNTTDLRLWVETKAAGIDRDKFELQFNALVEGVVAEVATA